MIIVTGATGRLGSAIIEHLVPIVGKANIVAVVHNIGKGRALTIRGISIRHGDYDQPESLLRAFSGASQVLLISSNGIDHEERVTRHLNAVDAAVRAGVGHLYYTSLVHSSNSAAFVVKAHVDTEQLVADSGIPYTIIRNGVYAEATESYLGNYSSGEVLVPADGPIAWVSRADLAAGIASILRAGTRAGETLQLTGSRALSIAEYTRILSMTTGRTIRVRTVPVDEFVTHQISKRKSVVEARRWCTTYTAIARGEFAVVDPLLEALLRRPLLNVETVLGQMESSIAANG